MTIPPIVRARPQTHITYAGLTGSTKYEATNLIRRHYGDNLFIVSGHPLLHTQIKRTQPPSGISSPEPGTLEYYRIIPIGEDQLLVPGYQIEAEPVINWKPTNTPSDIPTSSAMGWQQVANVWLWGIFPHWRKNEQTKQALLGYLPLAIKDEK